jgi:hypothetical protein
LAAGARATLGLAGSSGKTPERAAATSAPPSAGPKGRVKSITSASGTARADLASAEPATTARH